MVCRSVVAHQHLTSDELVYLLSKEDDAKVKETMRYLTELWTMADELVGQFQNTLLAMPGGPIYGSGPKRSGPSITAQPPTKVVKAPEETKALVTTEESAGVVV